jgi:CPA2 family monovalent cation:H+ antiporter-2
MHEITLLINIAVALLAAFIGGIIARRLGLPTIVGYLLAGIVIGPFVLYILSVSGRISRVTYT